MLLRHLFAIDDMAFDAIGLFSPTTMNDCGEEEVNPYYVDLLNYAVYQGFSALSDKNNFACLILNVIAATAIAEGIRANMASRDVAITSDDVDDCDAFAKRCIGMASCRYPSIMRKAARSMATTTGRKVCKLMCIMIPCCAISQRPTLEWRMNPISELHAGTHCVYSGHSITSLL